MEIFFRNNCSKFFSMYFNVKNKMQLIFLTKVKIQNDVTKKLLGTIFFDQIVI